MKRLLFPFLCLGLIVLSACSKSNDDADMEITDVIDAIPDDTFRKYCLNTLLDKFDRNYDGKLSKEEAAEIRSLNLDKNSTIHNNFIIYNLTGIEHFSSLIYLSCNSQPTKEINISQNLELETLACQKNQLQKLDISRNTKLTYLRCDFNLLKKLDMSKNAALIYLFCDNNLLTELDVSKNPNLITLNCAYNQLTELDL